MRAERRSTGAPIFLGCSTESLGKMIGRLSWISTVAEQLLVGRSTYPEHAPVTSPPQ